MKLSINNNQQSIKTNSFLLITYRLFDKETRNNFKYTVVDMKTFFKFTMQYNTNNII